MNEVVSQHPGREIHIILDDLKTHKSKRDLGRVENWRGSPKEPPCLYPGFPRSCPPRSLRNPVSSSRHLARSVRISRTTRSCTLHLKSYVAMD